MYLKKIYDLGLVQQIEKCYPGNYGAPGMPRKKKHKKTPEEIQKQNEINRWKKLQRMILANFKEGDWHLILKYRPRGRPDTYEEAKKHRKNFIDKMRDIFKAAGIPFKWITVTERGKKGQVLHFHFVIEDICNEQINTVKLVKKLWKHGNVFLVSLYEDGEYEKLAEYLVKAEQKEEIKGESYSHSRNLIIPQPKKKKVYSRKWKNPPVAPKGWYVVKESIVNGENPFTGRPYQHYTIKRLEGYDSA